MKFTSKTVILWMLGTWLCTLEPLESLLESFCHPHQHGPTCSQVIAPDGAQDTRPQTGLVALIGAVNCCFLRPVD
ncbi:hypothetical protein RRG08_025344 [Elysia crispata]|uniref:Secreted protein n=1 Tax=Elysia crispata TaxID=231223 RepID=A0AAE1DUN3_9GAST|nr:hypothetical protein RRG08_025344 [Elysia crispata]